MDARELLEVLVVLKRETVERVGGPVDLQAKLVIGYADGELAQFSVADTLNIAPALAMWADLRREAVQLVPMRAVEWVGFVGEAFGREAEPGTPEPARHTYQGEFEAGDLSVQEMLVATVVTPAGRSGASVDFHYGDHGEVEFGEPRVREGELVGGLVADSLAVVFQ